MKFKLLILLIFSITLIGCNNDDTDNNQAYNVNDRADEIRNQVKDMYANIRDNVEFQSSVPKNDAIPEVSEDITEDNPTDIPSPSEVVKDNTEEQNELITEPRDPNELATYTTQILTTDSNRYNNIKIVSDKLNEYILKPGETFSFNEVCGPFGESSGFLEATILLSDGTESKGFGGGVCQLSSTLYNAIKNLNVNITERHHHSAPVSYVPKNEDATVSMQSGLDFKFINNEATAIKFVTACNPDELTVTVYKSTDT